MAKRKAAPLRKLSTDEVLRLGPDAAAAKAALPSSVWKRIVKDAHGRGVTVGSYVKEADPALQARTKKSLQSEAAKRIGLAYKPAETELNTQATRIQGLSDKRAADLAHYNDWLLQQQAKFNEGAVAASDLVAKRQGEIQRDLAAAAAQGQQQATQNVQGAPGLEGFGSPAAGLSQQLKAGTDFGQQLVANTREQTNIEGSRGVLRSALDQANAHTYVAALQSRQASEAMKALRDVGDQKQKLLLDRGAKSAALVADMLNSEVKKAQSNRDTAAAAAAAQGKTELEYAKLKQQARVGQLERALKAREGAANRSSKEQIAQAGRNVQLEIAKGGARSREKIAALKKNAVKLMSDAEKRTRISEDRKLVGAIKAGLSAALAGDEFGKPLSAAQIRQKLQLQNIPADAADFVVNLVKGQHPGKLDPAYQHKLADYLWLSQVPPEWR